MIYENHPDHVYVMGESSLSYLEVDKAIKKVLPFLADGTTYSKEHVGNGKFRIGIGAEKR